jgi:hypothetical protein
MVNRFHIGAADSMALSIFYWANRVQNKITLTRKSENAGNSDPVLQFVFDEDTAVFNAVVRASMRDTSHRVRVGKRCYGVLVCKSLKVICL